MDPDKKHVVAVTAMVCHPSERKVLLLKRGAHEIAFPGKWAFPGGKVERGETLRAAVAREVLEEAGLEIDGDIAYEGDYTFVRPDGHNVVGVRFFARTKSANVRIPRDFDAFAWVAPEELSGYDHIPGMDQEVREAFAKRP